MALSVASFHTHQRFVALELHTKLSAMSLRWIGNDKIPREEHVHSIDQKNKIDAREAIDRPLAIGGTIIPNVCQLDCLA